MRMGGRVTLQTAGFFISTAVSCAMVAGCSCGGTHHIGDPDASSDAAETNWEDVPGVDERCGNSIVDDGEECDDGNRMNGDGCTWDCQLGDGDPPDDTPDPDVLPLEPDGSPETLVWGEEAIGGGSFDLEWNDTQYSLLYFYLLLGEPESAGFAFRRFHADGVELPNEWETVTSPIGIPATADHVWTGEEYGIFYAGADHGGIWFLRIGPTGKRLSDPMLNVDEPGACHQSVAWTGDAYGMSWVVVPEDRPGSCVEEPHPVYFEMVSDSGDRLFEEPVLLHERMVSPPRMVWGGDGAFRIAIATLLTPHPDCLIGVQEVTVLADGTILETTNIGSGNGPDIAWRDDEYVVAFDHSISGDYPFEYEGIYMARFEGAGHLIEAPYRFDATELVLSPVRITPDPLGYTVLWNRYNYPASGHSLSLTKTDSRGRAVGSPQLVAGTEAPVLVTVYDLVWADDAIGVAYALTDHGMGDDDGIYLQKYVVAGP